MSRSSLAPSQTHPATAIVRETTGTMRPATAEQALDALDLMMADVIAQAESTMAISSSGASMIVPNSIEQHGIR